MNAMDQIIALRDFGGERLTVGLTDPQIQSFLDTDPALTQAIDEAHTRHTSLRGEWGALLAGGEVELARELQSDFVNFYGAEAVNPYVALVGRGAWIITSHGAVLHDNGGYGMLGMGHGPPPILDAMVSPWVMANVMTPSISHKRFGRRLRAEIGQTRETGCPFDRFICMNSGSESVTVACRISDIHAAKQTAKGADHYGKTVKFLALKGAFHGRTDRPAQISDSSLPSYRKHLNSFMDRDNLLLCEANNRDQLKAVFAQAEADGVFIECMFMEPVMGEGNPGESITREFYDLARSLTHQSGSLLMVDSIQAGLRGTGYLSIVDYPGFASAEAPDMETYSKALNAGQYPLSVLAMNSRTSHLYARGVYGNTMTTNPRALEVACAVLDHLTDDTRQNIRDRGDELVERITAMQHEFPGLITLVRGTGLLLCCEIDPKRAMVVGFDGLETWCRRHGLGVIHGGENAIRFTPRFDVTSAELELIIDVLRECFTRVVQNEALTAVTAQTLATPAQA
ncbi:MAG: aminotransferase class III-fold pyridoxal phosphate-dependent enzyme [Rhodobacterales bacterium]|nr:aminotransferase class III-fold pyridoxal phosphate-dependent enzyme [Rhodobacterales bacterium]